MKRTALVLALVTAFVFPGAAYAQGGIVYGDRIPAGVTVDHDVLLIGNNVSIEGTVNGNAFILGNQIVISGRVNGSLVMLAQNAAIGGEVTGAVYAAALTLDLPEAGTLDRDLYALTVSLTSRPTSAIGRHLFALGLDAGLNGQIGGDLHTAIGPIQLYNGLVRMLGFEELTLELHFEAPPPASPQSGVAPTAAKATLRFKLQNPLPQFDWSAWGFGVLRGWGVLFAVSLLWLWIARPALEEVGSPIRLRPWRTLGLGLVVLVVSLNLFLVGLLVAALIFAVGLGLNAIGLWPITIALWVLAYSAIAVALTLLWLFILYGTRILVAYHGLGWLISKTTWPRTTWTAVLTLFIGTLIYTMLRSVPSVGWVIGLLVIAAGMGSAWLAYREPSRTAAVRAVAEFPKPAARAPRKPAA